MIAVTDAHIHIQPFEMMPPAVAATFWKGKSNRAELEKWETRLDELGIAHGGIKDASYGSGLSFRDPDNLPLEFFAPPV